MRCQLFGERLILPGLRLINWHLSTLALFNGLTHIKRASHAKVESIPEEAKRIPSSLNKRLANISRRIGRIAFAALSTITSRQTGASGEQFYGVAEPKWLTSDSLEFVKNKWRDTEQRSASAASRVTLTKSKADWTLVESPIQ